MSKPTSTLPSSAATPAPSSPPPSESFFSDLDGTAASVLDGGEGIAWDQSRIDPKALNLVSWKLDVNAVAEDGVNKRGFNAISTVLNHPTRKANPLRSSRKPLPPLGQPPLQLPKPPPPTFYDSYLKSISPLYETFRSAEASSIAGPSSITLDADPSQTSATGKDLPPLSSVPEIFFESDFDLSNPSTWSSVVNPEEEGEASSEAGVVETRDTKDTLSTHLDVLEGHLVHEITLRSTAFFSALSNLQDLHSESTSCLSRISSLQSSLRSVGSKQAQKGLDIIDEHENLRILRSTEAGIKEVVELDDLMRIAKELVDAGDWAGGLSYLQDVVRWWEGHGTSPVISPIEDSAPTTTDSKTPLRLSTLPAMSALPKLFGELVSSISIQLQSSLNSLLLAKLSQAETTAKFGPDSFKSSIQPILIGLIQCGKAETLEDVWREVLTTSVREGSRKHLPVLSQEDEAEEDGKAEGSSQQRGANLATSLRSMDHSQFLLLSSHMFSTVLSRLRLAKDMGDQMVDIVSSSEVPPLALKPVEPVDGMEEKSPVKDQPPFDLSDVLASGCELANVRASKVLAVRSEQNAALPLPEFVEIFKESWEFVMFTEQLAKRMIVPLRGVTASQARAFLVSYHGIRLTKSAKLVEEEQWTQIDVSPPVQHIVDMLIEAAVSDPVECLVPAPPKVPNGDASEVSKKVLSVEDKTFHVVKATAESLVLLADYLKIVINLELVVTDVMSRIIEFLKSFNSRTCQVVLGAGAMRSAGLKNITAKHLALASQSLSIVISLIPYIREFVRRHLSTKQAVMLTEFDKLKRDYQEHQNEIHAKLVAIMSDRLAVHCSSLRAIDWETAPDSVGPNAYAELLAKETATLHKVLSKYLAPSTVQNVMTEVVTAIVDRFSDEYGKVELKTEDAKKSAGRMLTDAVLIKSRLSSIVEDSDSVASLETLVKNKPLPRTPVGQAMRGLINRVNSGGGPKSPTAELSPSNSKSSLTAMATSPTAERSSGEIPTNRTSTEEKGESVREAEKVALGKVLEEEEGPTVASEPVQTANGVEEAVPGSGVPKIDANTGPTPQAESEEENENQDRAGEGERPNGSTDETPPADAVAEPKGGPTEVNGTGAEEPAEQDVPPDLPDKSSTPTEDVATSEDQTKSATAASGEQGDEPPSVNGTTEAKDALVSGVRGEGVEEAGEGGKEAEAEAEAPKVPDKE